MDSSPSFNTYSCINTMDIANRVVQELHNDSEFKDLICIDEEINEAEENTQEDEFQFPLVFTDHSSLADNIINDQITPRYPLFDKSLLLNLDSNSSNTIDSKPAPASTPILAPTTDTVSTVTLTSTIVAASTPTLTPATVVTPTSTIVAASAPTLASVTDKISTSVTPTSTLASVTDKVSTFVTPTSTPAPTTDKISTSVTPTSTPAPTTDKISTSVIPTSTQAPATDTDTDTDTDTISTIVPTITQVTAAAPTLLTSSTVTNPDPASPPPTRLSLGKLFSEDPDSATQSSTLVLESKDFNTISSPQTYCIWKPQEQEHQLPPKQHHSRGKHKKSNSISISSEEETSPKRWRVRDLLKRSYSDDSRHTSLSSIFYSPSPKEKIGKDGSVVVFLPKPSNEKVKKPEKALKTTASMGGRCTNHKPEDKTPAYKTKIGNIRLPAFLPYRQDQHQVDAFANYTNNGPSKHMYR